MCRQTFVIQNNPINHAIAVFPTVENGIPAWCKKYSFKREVQIRREFEPFAELFLDLCSSDQPSIFPAPPIDDRAGLEGHILRIVADNPIKIMIIPGTYPIFRQPLHVRSRSFHAMRIS